MNPIVLIHGALGCGKQLEPVRSELEKVTGREIYIYNCPGHGGETIPKGGFDIPFLTASFGKWLQSENLLGADVFGYSMGGYIALSAVRNHPQRIRHILTLGTKFDWSPETAEKESGQLVPAKIREKVPKFAAYLESLHGPEWEQVVKTTAQLMRKLGEKPGLDSYALGFIQHPVVLCRGSRDSMVTREETVGVENDLPDGRYLEIEGWPHPIQLLDPKQVSGLIIRHFGE